MNLRGTIVLSATASALALTLLAPGPAGAISGGTEAPAPYPFTGSLNRSADSPRPDGHVCGVTLVAPQWVITAAHCARNDQDSQFGYPHGWFVRLGSTRAAAGGERIDVEEYVRRSNGPLVVTFGKDVALLKLKHPAKARPIRIVQTPPPPGTATRIMGWGVTCDQNTVECFPATLRQADTEVQPPSSCPGTAPDLCIGSRDGTVGPTNMDSGGPALVRRGATWELAGVVSGGADGTPGIYTNAAVFRHWVQETVTTRTPTLAGSVSLGSCAGALIHGAAARAQDPALVLTNGHCIQGDRPPPGSAVVDRPEPRDVTILDAHGQVEATARTTKLIYATMTGTDVAVYQLDRTYAQLAADHVTVFDLATTPAQQADPIDLISGSHRKTWACAVANVVPELREGGYSLRNAIQEREDCSPGPGDSGTPMLDPHTGEIVGIHNTSNGSGGVCTDGNPCEVDEFGRVTVHVGRTYGQQTAAVPGCLAPGSVIDLHKPECTLTKPVN